VLRNIVDKESVVDEIANTYAEDGKSLVDGVRGRRDKEMARAMQGVKKKGKTVKKELEAVAKKLKDEKEDLKRRDVGL
jgi:hypothetical protein